MALIASISGIRGTIGGSPTQGLTPVDIVKFAAAYGTWLQTRTKNGTIVVGRDARPSGPMVQALVCNTLVGMGFRIVDLGLATTPTVEIAVPELNAAGGIILTASHNPEQWNALKLLNEKGEFLSNTEGRTILDFYDKECFVFAPVEGIGTVVQDDSWLQRHVDYVLALPLVNIAAIKQKRFRVAVDAVNSSGGIYVPALLRALGCEVAELNCEPSGRFAHNPEPLAEHLDEIRAYIRQNPADLGIVVDPDVDRLALVTEQGEMFGEEYTLVAVADYVLGLTPGPAVSNLSSSRALRDVAQRHNQPCFAAAVGEVNVVAQMKQCQAAIGGEGNGGVIYPNAHYGRDALVGIGLFLSHLATSGLKTSELRARYPNYAMSKQKIELTAGFNVESLLAEMASQHAGLNPDCTDGVKFDFEDSWVHLRKSNTEPIIRIYTEAPTQTAADALASRFREQLQALATKTLTPVGSLA